MRHSVCAGRQRERPFERCAPHGAGLGDQLLEQVEMLLVHAARRGLVADADPGGFAHHLPHHAAGLHHAHRPERFVRYADVAARHEQVADVAAVEAAVGRPVRPFVAVVLARCAV